MYLILKKKKQNTENLGLTLLFFEHTAFLFQPDSMSP